MGGMRNKVAIVEFKTRIAFCVPGISRYMQATICSRYPEVFRFITAHDIYVPGQVTIKAHSLFLQFVAPADQFFCNRFPVVRINFRRILPNGLPDGGISEVLLELPYAVVPIICIQL